MSPPKPSVSQMFAKASAGDQSALSSLVPLVYEELRRLAARYLRRERQAPTLQATMLVHEAYLRLLGDEKLQWKDRAHFLGIAARSMRQILIERARARNAQKRGGDQHPITLNDELIGQRERSIDVLALEAALEQLDRLDPEQARLVELRFFGGLTVEEVAEVMGISPATVKRRWTFARAWLRREMEA